MVLAAVAIPSLWVYSEAIKASGQLAPGEDVIEPLALIAAPVAANACYTFGALTSLALRTFCPSTPGTALQRLYRAGIVFSLVVVTAPAAYWLTVAASSPPLR